MIVFTHDGPSGSEFKVHSVDAPNNFTGYILHTRNKSQVAYHALGRDDLAALRDAINAELGSGN